MTLFELKKIILERGCYAAEENLRIYNKFFGRLPLTFRIPLKKYKLGELRVLDIGCTYGNYLINFGPGSAGVDISDNMINFARSIGLNIVKSNIDQSLNVPDNYFDAVWCSNLLEHVESPHLFLRQAYPKLRPDGLLFIKVPLVIGPISSWLYRLLIGSPGYLNGEHLYAYSQKTIEFIIERAGYKVIESNVFLPTNQFLNKLINPLLKHFSPTITVVAKKQEGFKYCDKRPV